MEKYVISLSEDESKLLREAINKAIPIVELRNGAGGMCSCCVGLLF